MPDGRNEVLAHDAAELDTFPKYLLLNAERFGDRPAMRHKDFGIWQSWSWKEQLEEIRAFAIGLKAMGIGHGDKVAVVGANRPRLYWAIAALQSLRAIPVPVYADAVAEEMAYVLSHAGVRVAIVQDQEQVDKLQTFAESIPALRTLIYDEPRGLADYDTTDLKSYADVQEEGRAIMRRDASAATDWEANIRAASGDDVSIMLYTSGTTGRSKGVMIRAGAAVKAARDTVEFDRITEKDSVLAYLPLAWVGDHYLNYAQGYISGFCVNCPESPETVAQDLREIGPTFYFAPPRIFEGLLTMVTIRMEDAGRLKKWLFHRFVAHARKYGEAILEGRPVPFAAVEAFLDLLRAVQGEKLLRMKGIVELAEDPERPLVIHGVQKLLHPPARLPAWPEGARGTRIVLITCDMPPDYARRLFAAFVGEPAVDTPDRAALQDNPLAIAGFRG